MSNRDFLLSLIIWALRKWLHRHGLVPLDREPLVRGRLREVIHGALIDLVDVRGGFLTASEESLLSERRVNGLEHDVENG